MEFALADDLEAVALRTQLGEGACEVNSEQLLTANLWLFEVSPPVVDGREVLSTLLCSQIMPHREMLEPALPSRTWMNPAECEFEELAARFLLDGVVLEPGAFVNDPEGAERFVARLLCWVEQPLKVFANMRYERSVKGSFASGFRVFRVPGWFDEGFVLVGARRLAMLWFVGTD